MSQTIECQWSTCSAQLRSDDIIPHLSKSHLIANHMKTREDGMPCKWENCNLLEKNVDDLLSHVVGKHVFLGSVEIANPLICNWVECSNRFPTFDQLTSHLSEVHVGYGKSTYICYWNACQRNQRPFQQRQKIMRHLQTHTGDKPFECRICHQKFSDLGGIQQHSSVHLEIKPFKCSVCNKEFRQQSQLTVHIRRHTGEKPFKCTVQGCEKQFPESSNLSKHLRVHDDSILEIAVLVTDGNLENIIKGPHLIIHKPKEQLDAMDEWCRTNHGASGLVSKVLESKNTTSMAQDEIMQFLKNMIPPKTAVLAGNSVHVDRQFLCKEMPDLIEYLHYRIVDVSSIKELCRRWYPKEYSMLPKKRLAHRAMDDILESIEELKYYRKAIFK